MSTTAATTTPLMCSPTRSMRSTFNPAAVSRSASSCALADGNSTCACSHDNGTRMSALLPERQSDAHVALDQVADLGQVVLRHQRACNSHAEREPGIDRGVHARRGEHYGMHHPATAPLDPAFAAAGAARFGIRLQRRAVAHPTQQVYFRRWLGEREVVRSQAGADVVTEHRPSPQLERAAE